MREGRQVRPSFYAVIPAEVRYSSINANSKLLFGEITALCNKEGYCWASNAYLAELYEVQPRQVSRWIQELQNCHFIEVELKPSSKGVLRKISIVTDPMVNPGIAKDLATRQKRRGGIDKKDVGNNTSNNKSINTLVETPEVKQIATLLADLISERNPSIKQKLLKDSKNWCVEIERLHRIDGASWKDIEGVVRWCQADSFWQNNVLSGAKLRKQWVTLLTRSGLGNVNEVNYDLEKMEANKQKMKEVEYA